MLYLIESSTRYWGQLSHHPIPDHGLITCSCSWNKCLLISMQQNISLCNCLDNQNSALDAIQLPSNQTFKDIACGDLHQLAITSRCIHIKFRFINIVYSTNDFIQLMSNAGCDLE